MPPHIASVRSSTWQATTRRSCHAAGITTLLLLLAAPAAAQERVYVGGLGGVTFNTVSSGVFAGNAGVHVGRGIFVTGEVGRAANVLPKEVEDELDAVRALVEELTGVPVSLRVSLPATYAFGGARWFGPGQGRLRPVVEGGLGVAHLSANIRASLGGVPVPRDVIDDFQPVDLDSNELLFVVGGGITIGLTRTVSVDAGYRFFHLAVEEDAPTSNTSVIYAGIRIGFGGR